jgi:coenzyme F420 hydrogenase subunit delta
MGSMSLDERELPDHLRKRVVVLGVGNSLLGDDGFGPATVQFMLKSMEVPGDVCVLDAGTAVMPILLDILLSDVGPKRLIILDTADLGKKPGELVRMSVKQLPQTRGNIFSFHTFSARMVLQELENRKCMEVIILACQAEEISPEIREGLSEPVKDAVGLAGQIVLEMASN